MKKVILLLAILCASMLNGMEPENSYESLPKELKQQIITTALESSKTIPQAIDAIEKFSILYNIPSYKLFFGDFKIFTAVVGTLETRFKHPRKFIAERWFYRIYLSTQYTTLGARVYGKIVNIGNEENVLNIVHKLLDEGADPNFSWKPNPSSPKTSLLEETYKIYRNKRFEYITSSVKKVYHSNDELMMAYEDTGNTLLTIINLLLHRGAKPTAQLIETAQKEAQKNPTDLNIAICDLFMQAALK